MVGKVKEKVEKEKIARSSKLKKVDNGSIVIASGKRKTAIARATLRKGSGIVRINKVPLDLVMPETYRLKLREPLLLSDGVSDKIDIDVNVFGGGITSQADASRTSIAKGLVEYTNSDKLRETFLDYDRSLLVADTRKREAAKPNRHGKARAKVAKSYR